MRKCALLMTVPFALIIALGCELNVPEEMNNVQQPPQDSSQPQPSPVVQANGDAIPLSSISWLGANYASASKTATIRDASLNSSTIYTSYDRYRWPSSGGVDAICCIFYQQGGRIVGGKFDWWRNGGQGAKTLENVHHGYNGHRMPARGTPTYTMIVSVDGKQRSNIQACSWR